MPFLRSDIFNELRFNDKNKMTADIEYLEWPDQELIEVAAARIARSLGGPKKSACCAHALPRCRLTGAWNRI